MGSLNLTDPGSVYKDMLEKSQLTRNELLRRGRFFSITRFLTFLIFLVLAVSAITLGPGWWWPAASFLIGFIILVVLHEKLINRQKFNDNCIIAINHELDAIEGRHTQFANGAEFNDPAHIFTTDLDIFGDNSLFQALNRTSTINGKETLAGWLKMPLSEKAQITARQQAVNELASKPEWRIKLRAHGMVVSEEKKDFELLSQWLGSAPLFDSPFFRIAILLIPLASFLVTALLIAGIISIKLFLVYLLLPLTVVGIYTKAINGRHMLLSKKVDLLQRYSIRFRMMEDEGFQTEFMNDLVNKLITGNRVASHEIHQLGRITASLDSRLNLLAGFVLNIYLLWDVRQMMRLEKWQNNHRDSLPLWFESLSGTEAIASFGAFLYANPGFVFPEINNEKFEIFAVDAGHPLIPAKQCVKNDIQITHKGHFNIITGANMAGKSTYLRTIGVNMALALAGAPVCAAKFICYPAKVFTSLRTTDSLSTNQSYFYAELLRLKELIDRLNAGEELFILLDEILKGTNSADKQAGSKALLTQLIGLEAAGFIATHDLELGNLINSFSDDITNYCFEAEIKGDELFFDYKLKPGIARNLNATFLMNKMGITI